MSDNKPWYGCPKATVRCYQWDGRNRYLIDDCVACWLECEGNLPQKMKDVIEEMEHEGVEN